MTATVTTPVFVNSTVDGSLNVDMSAIASGSPALWIKGIATTLNAQGADNRTLAASGAIKFMGAGRDAGQIAIKIGNTSTQWTGSTTSYTACPARLSGITTWGVHTSIFCTNYDMYLVDIEDFNFGIGYYGVVFGGYTGTTTERNSGERITLRAGTIYGMRYGMQFGMNATFIDIVNTSFDYITYDVLSIPESTYNIITLSKVHVEAVGGYLVNSASPGNTVVNLDRTDYLTTLNGGAQVTSTESNSICRQMFNLSSGTTVNTFMFGQLSPAQLPHNNKIWLNDSGLGRVNQLSPSPMAAVPRPGTPSEFLLDYSFANSPVGTAINALTGFTLSFSSGITVASSKIENVASANMLKIALTTEGSTAWSFTLLSGKVPVVGGGQYCAGLAYMPLLSGTSGSYVYTYSWYDIDGNLISSENYTGPVAPMRNATAIPGYVEPGVVSDSRTLPVYMASRYAPARAVYMTISYQMTQLNASFYLSNLYLWRAR